MLQENYFFIESLNELYEAVQKSSIFPDSKFFVDAIPRSNIENILADYTNEKLRPGFMLIDFVNKHFDLPSAHDTGYQSANKPIGDHLRQLWILLRRTSAVDGGTLIALPNPYIIPGGRFREIYYWDSYFTMLGLQVSGEHQLINDMIGNFAWLIDSIGFIPNGNRTYYMGRSQPPFFALMVALLNGSHDHRGFLQYQKQLEKEYSFWMEGSDRIASPGDNYRHTVMLEGGLIANRYWDNYDTPRPEAFAEDIHLAEPNQSDNQKLFRNIRAAAESGWDFSSRWFRAQNDMSTIHTTDIIPVDLNCLMLFLEQSLCSVYAHEGDEMMVQAFELKISNRKKVIQAFCWNPETKFYGDYDFVLKKSTPSLHIGGAYPLYFHVADKTQAAAVATRIGSDFLKPGGLLTTLALTGQQWDAPNGWAPLQWMAYEGLRRYEFTELACQIKNNWTKNCERGYSATGKMMEKYNVADLEVGAGGGEYPNQDGFGWTNGVYLRMMADET